MELVAGETVGIDLGTVYSTVAQLNADGIPTVLKNASEKNITASAIVLNDDSTALIAPDRSQYIYSPERVITGVKRKMGDSKFHVTHGERELNAEVLSAMILRKLKQDAEQHIGLIGNAVITVPYYFNDVCRRSTYNAGRMAGLNVIDIINEPTAATLAHAWMNGDLGRIDESADKEKTLLVYDLGGGTFDVTLVRYTATHFQVIATDGDVLLGGLDWTERLADFVGEKFLEKHGVNPNDDPVGKFDLMQICEDAKRCYSEQSEVVINVSYIQKHLTLRVPHQQYMEMTADLLQRTQDTTELVLQTAKIAPEEVDELLLVGGSTYLPEVSKMLSALCQREVTRLLDPQLAVAQGAAIHAAIIEAKETGGAGHIGKAVLKRLKAITSVDVNPHSLGVVISDHKDPKILRNHIMIPRNSSLPVGVEQRFVTTLNNPEGIRIKLLEGEAESPSACTFIGSVRIRNLPPGIPAGSPVEVRYRYNEQRRIIVSARELSTNSEATVEIVWEGLSPNNSFEALQALNEFYRVE